MFFKRMKLGTKLLSGFLLVALVTIAMGLVGFKGMSDIMEQSIEVGHNRLPSVQALLTIGESQMTILAAERGLTNSRMTAPEVREAQYKIMAEAWEQVEAAWKVYEPLPQTPEEAVLWKDFVLRWEAWKNSQRKVVDLAKERDSLIAEGVPSSDPRISALDVTTVEASLTARDSILPAMKLLKEIIALNEKVAKEAVARADVHERNARIVIIVAMLLAVLLSVGIGVFITRLITVPIKSLGENAEKIAEGDLSVVIAYESADEIGHLADSFRKMAGNLHDLLVQISSSSEMVAAAAEQLSTASEQVAAGSEEVAAQTQTVATAGEEMAATSNDIARNCILAAEASKVANDTALNGAAVVENTVRVMNRIAERVKESAGSVAELGSRSDQIGEIVGTIEEIADQTNLLALNAAIEAARAGEQGRGFAVVADEVRALAERTTKATKEIGGMIKAIQTETRGAVNSMEEGVREVENGTAEAAKSGEALEQILNQITSVGMQVNQMATAAEQQTSTTDEISRNIQEITSVVQDSANGAQQSAESAKQLAHLAGTLQQAVGRFRLATSA